MQLNYYSILGLKRTATQPEIKAAYKKLAVQYHPDKHQGNTHFEDLFKQVSEAYQILSNPQKRRVYDLKLEYVAQQQRVQQQQRAYYSQQRRPASVNERYYRTISKKRKFSRRDWQITIGFFVALILFSLAVKITMDFIAAKTHYKKADVLMTQKQWAGAHSLLSEAINFEPEFAEAYQKRGFINQNIYKDYEAAIYDYSAAMRFGDAPQAEVYFQRGQCHAKLHNFRQAEADFTSAIGVDKNYCNAYLSRGELRLLELNLWNEAVNDLSFFLKKPTEVAAKNKALLYRGFAFYQLDSRFNILEKNAIQTGQKTTAYRILKAEKPDYESTCLGEINGEKYLLAFGSGSKSPERDSLLAIPLHNPEAAKTYSLRPLYDLIKTKANLTDADINVEGSAIIGDALFLFNRGQNVLIQTNWAKIILFLKGGPNTLEPQLKTYRIKIPQIKGITPGFSGACQLGNENKLLFTASVENTRNWIDDGEILGSFIGVLNVEKLTSETPENVVLLTAKNGSPLIEKVESIEFLQREANGNLKVLCLTDDDQGSSKILEIRLKP